MKKHQIVCIMNKFDNEEGMDPRLKEGQQNLLLLCYFLKICVLPASLPTVGLISVTPISYWKVNGPAEIK